MQITGIVLALVLSGSAAISQVSSAPASELAPDLSPRSINDISAVPTVGPKGRAGYEDFVRASPPKAFAIASSGAWGWRTGKNAATQAKNTCDNFAKAKKVRCIIYAIDNKVVWRPDPNATQYANEALDWGVTPTSAFRAKDFESPTPTTAPGTQTILTKELLSLLNSSNKPVVIDVLSMDHPTIPGATLLPGMGLGFETSTNSQKEFEQHLEKVTNKNKNRDIIFLCVSAHCWLSYNASMRAANLGYVNVRWYRGGLFAWRAAGLPVTFAK